MIIHITLKYINQSAKQIIPHVLIFLLTLIQLLLPLPPFPFQLQKCFPILISLTLLVIPLLWWWVLLRSESFVPFLPLRLLSFQVGRFTYAAALRKVLLLLLPWILLFKLLRHGSVVLFPVDLFNVPMLFHRLSPLQLILLILLLGNSAQLLAPHTSVLNHPTHRVYHRHTAH